MLGTFCVKISLVIVATMLSSCKEDASWLLGRFATNDSL